MGTVIGVLFGLSLAMLAYAETPDNNAKARAHFRNGMARYVLNHYDAAIVEFEAGYATDPLPAFLFNLAQCHAKAGRKEKAIEFYRKYLDMGAPTQDAIMVQEAIDRLERELRPPPQVDTTPTMVTKTAPPAAVEPPAAKPALVAVAAAPGRSKKYAGIATAAVGVAALAAGMGLSLTAKANANELTTRDQTHGVFDQDLSSAGKTFDAAGAAMLAIGGAALVAGVVVAVLGLRESRRAKSRATVGASSLRVAF